MQLRSSPLGLILVSAWAAVGALSCASAPGSRPAKTAVAAAPTGAAPAPPPAAPITDDGPPVDRVALPPDGPSRGPAAAKVTIVEFSDFQCPFCARVNPTLDQIRATYPDDVRIVFRENPLPFHPHAAEAAEAAVAAGWQGKFWQMHDKLFANQRDLDRQGLEARAAELGLDLPTFRRALDTHAAKAQVDADLALGQKVGLRGTPTFFIDGRTLVGAQPFAEFKQVIDDELARADRLLARGVPRDKLYATLLVGAKPSISASRDQVAAAGATVYRVPTLDAPVRGGAQPKVTIVEFSDFQCPFCGRVKPTLDTLLRSYGPDLALVYRHNPLPFHQNALPAAKAAEAARAQGKFWEMHDKLFANQQDLDRDALERYARELGLDLPRFKRDLDGELAQTRIDRDADDAQRFSSGGTPVFFINGRTLSGAQPLAAFQKTIDEEIRKADTLLAAGTPRAGLYQALTKDGLDTRAVLPPVKRDPDADRRIRVDVTGAPARGPTDGPLTIVEFADFQCPFCARAEETLERLRHDHPDQIRFVWRDLPLPFHDEARPAAIAARAAAAQGKFWAMHDRLYAAPHGTLGRDRYERDAAELGLDLRRFRAALDAEAGKAGIDADGLAALKAGATATPTFYLNGKRLVGAQPYETLKPLVDAELQNAEAMIAKGTPRARIYDALMKDAIAVRPPGQTGDDSGDDDGARRPEGNAPKRPEKTP